jgi:hypothetical protein
MEPGSQTKGNGIIGGDPPGRGGNRLCRSLLANPTITTGAILAALFTRFV